MKQFCLYFCLFICLSCLGCQSQSTTSTTIPQPSPKETVSEQPMNNDTEKPPEMVIDAVLEMTAQSAGVTKETLKIQETKAEIWSDGCLGLAKPDEICTQALVEGWQVVVSNDDQTWVYRTDKTGQTIRLES